MWAWLVGTISFVVTLGVFAFTYGKGTSYLSDSPAACANCHIMKDTYASWMKSQHHNRATCNDCHVPRHPILKWAVKGMNGLHHGYAFTFQKPPAVLRAASLSRSVVQESCLTCHESTVGHTALAKEQAQACTHCHRDVGHEHH
jgi:cytochrome c nitrite reductase small subunit